MNTLELYKLFRNEVMNRMDEIMVKEDPSTEERADYENLSAVMDIVPIYFDHETENSLAKIEVETIEGY